MVILVYARKRGEGVMRDVGDTGIVPNTFWNRVKHTIFGFSSEEIVEHFQGCYDSVCIGLHFYYEENGKLVEPDISESTSSFEYLQKLEKKKN